jgi:hypothetical protein
LNLEKTTVIIKVAAVDRVTKRRWRRATRKALRRMKGAKVEKLDVGRGYSESKLIGGSS